MSDIYLTLKQAAERAEVSQKTIKKWIKLGLPVINFNPRMRRIRVAALDKWLASLEVIFVGSPMSPLEESSEQSKNQVVERTRISR